MREENEEDELELPEDNFSRISSSSSLFNQINLINQQNTNTINTNTTNTNTIINLEGNKSEEEEGLSITRYTGELWNPLLKSKHFHWPEYRTKKLEDMEKDGWIIDPSKNPDIGITIRRFFHGFGKADGVVVGHLPGELNDGHTLWHVVHDDGDSEDISDDDLHLCREMFLKNNTQPHTIQKNSNRLFNPSSSSLSPPSSSHQLTNQQDINNDENLDHSSTIFRDSYPIGPDHQVEDIPDCINSNYNNNNNNDNNNNNNENEQDSFLISSSSEINTNEIVNMQEYKNFERLAWEILIFPGVITRYIGMPTEIVNSPRSSQSLPPSSSPSHITP